VPNPEPTGRLTSVRISRPSIGSPISQSPISRGRRDESRMGNRPRRRMKRNRQSATRRLPKRPAALRVHSAGGRWCEWVGAVHCNGHIEYRAAPIQAKRRSVGPPAAKSIRAGADTVRQEASAARWLPLHERRQACVRPPLCAPPEMPRNGRAPTPPQALPGHRTDWPESGGWPLPTERSLRSPLLPYSGRGGLRQSVDAGA